MDNTVELINAAGRLLQDRSKRCKGWFAKDSEGWPVNVCDPRACCFCLAGAIRLTAKDSAQVYNRMYMYARALLGLEYVSDISRTWDNACPVEQDKIVETLINYKG